MRFESGEWLAALWAAPAALVLAGVALALRREAARRFVEAGLLPSMAPARSAARLVVRGALLALALGLAASALARPQWGKSDQTIRKQGRDVCFVIDVSRSMLAEDLVPNRLERAKLWVSDVLAKMKGDRVAIVVFAGVPLVKCPMTLDYGFARLALQDVSTESVSRGGTLIGDALRLALTEVFEPDDPSFKDIILITDGEDHESFPVDAAKQAGEAGVRIIAIGVGDEDAGRPIQITDARTGERTVVKYKGEPVLSRLDAATLREVAAASRDGVYFNVATGTIELDTVYNRLVRQAEQKELEATQKVRYEERFQIFLGGALACLAAAGLISERRRS